MMGWGGKNTRIIEDAGKGNTMDSEGVRDKGI